MVYSSTQAPRIKKTPQIYQAIHNKRKAYVATNMRAEIEWTKKKWHTNQPTKVTSS
jgi:hypothetical protein